MAFRLTCCFILDIALGVCVPFLLDVLGRMWHSIVSVPKHYLLIYFVPKEKVAPPLHGEGNNNNSLPLFDEDSILCICLSKYGPQHNKLNNITLYSLRAVSYQHTRERQPKRQTHFAKAGAISRKRVPRAKYVHSQL